MRVCMYVCVYACECVRMCVCYVEEGGRGGGKRGEVHVAKRGGSRPAADLNLGDDESGVVGGVDELLEESLLGGRVVEVVTRDLQAFGHAASEVHETVHRIALHQRLVVPEQPAGSQ